MGEWREREGFVGRICIWGFKKGESFEGCERELMNVGNKRKNLVAYDAEGEREIRKRGQGLNCQLPSLYI